MLIVIEHIFQSNALHPSELGFVPKRRGKLYAVFNQGAARLDVDASLLKTSYFALLFTDQDRSAGLSHLCSFARQVAFFLLICRFCRLYFCCATLPSSQYDVYEDMRAKFSDIQGHIDDCAKEDN